MINIFHDLLIFDIIFLKKNMHIYMTTKSYAFKVFIIS